MAADNTSKWKAYMNDVLSASGGVQNLNTDLQKNLGDEQDFVINTLMGGNGVVGSGSFAPTSGAGYLVNLAAGVAIIDGQVVKATGTTAVNLVADGTYEVYIQAGTPFSNTLHAWPVVGGKAAGTPAGALKICTVVSSSSGASKVITDTRPLLLDLTAIGARIPSVGEKSALAGTSGAPGSGNKFVTDTDPRMSYSRNAAFGVL